PSATSSRRTNVPVASTRSAVTTRIGVTVTAIAATSTAATIPTHAGRPRARRRARPTRGARAPALETEQAPDLSPGRQREEDAHGEEHDEDDPEPRSGALRAPTLLDPGLATGTVDEVRAADGIRVGRGALGGELVRNRLPRRLPKVLGHRRSIRPRRGGRFSEILSRVSMRERRFDPGLLGLGDGLGV